MREKVVEKYLREEIEKLGGTCEKFVSPGKRGVPDRIITMPGGVIEFVELKAPKKPTLRAAQARDHARRRAMGCTVTVIRTKTQVDEYVAELYADLSVKEPVTLH